MPAAEPSAPQRATGRRRRWGSPRTPESEAVDLQGAGPALDLALAVLRNTDPDGALARRAGTIAASAVDARQGLRSLVPDSLPPARSTMRRVRLLVEVGAADLSTVRLLEGHLDALAILDELGGPAVVPGRRAGVWASKAGGHGIAAQPCRGGWRLDGSMAYCSGAPFLDQALVVADHDGAERLFLVDLKQSGVAVQAGTWSTVGMSGSHSETVTFDRVRVPAPHAVGGPGAYTGRPGFWAGAVGVAACWAGGALGVARVGLDASRGSSDPHRLAHLGAAISTWAAMWTVLADAAAAIDDGAAGEVRAQVVRHQVESGCQRLIEHVGRLTGPGPMVSDPAHARRIPDLLVYLRQHHGEADLARLGSLISRATDRAPRS